MNRNDYLHLLAERTALQRMVADIPEENVIDRGSLMGRLEEIEYQIENNPIDEREPARVQLTFQGPPVIGSHGIYADFGMEAVTGLTETVTTVAASLSTPLRAKGPIPGREQHQLLITNTALGSFGFELEEYRAGKLPLDEMSPVAQAIELTQKLLASTLGSDDDLADAAAETDPRAMEKVRSFLQVLAKHGAICAIRHGEREFRFRDVGEVQRSLKRISTDNLHESEETLEGAFVAALPCSRAFEFQLATGETISGKVAPVVENIDAINDHRRRPTSITVMVKRVGEGRPRYTLLAMPAWPDDLPQGT